jgi:hypothetical protein|tara:strand:- start:4284 stop:4469 length:186 start_codon:yes stop_codon:yes gene_type:complete
MNQQLLKNRFDNPAHQNQNNNHNHQLVMTGGNGQFSQQKLRAENMNILGSVFGNDKPDSNP